MKLAIGLLMVVGGVILGAYVGLYLCLYGGIVQIVQSIVAPQVDAFGVATGIVRVFITGVAGWLSASILAFPGMAIVSDS